MVDTYNTNKLSLKVAKSSLTRAISHIEESCKNMLKAPEDTSAATKLRLAAEVVKALDLVTEEQTKLSNVREETMNSVVQFDSDEFSKVSNKNKDEVIADMEKDIQN